MPSVDSARMKEDFEALSRIGYCESDGGIYRPGFSEADMEARHWLAGRFRDCGLETRIDSVGNVIGRYGPAQGPCVMVGSHLDSVPCAGKFDGALGVIAGLECVRTVMEDGRPLDYAVEIVGTSEEEGRFGGMLGAQAMTGRYERAWLESAHDLSGDYLKDAMARAGFDYREIDRARRASTEIVAFLELHVEQGPVLETAGVPIGVVEGISGVFLWDVVVEGAANHAGTTPMGLRRDAFVGVADFVHDIDRIIVDHGSEHSRITLGQLHLSPGAPHIIPGSALFTLVGRDLSLTVMEALANACRDSLDTFTKRRGLTWSYDELSFLEPKPCSPRIVDLLEAKARARGCRPIRMPSGAGHDTQLFSDFTDTGMIFVPSVGGVSHSPMEWTDWSDAEKGANVLLDTMLALAAPGSGARAAS